MKYNFYYQPDEPDCFREEVWFAHVDDAGEHISVYGFGVSMMLPRGIRALGPIESKRLITRKMDEAVAKLGIDTTNLNTNTHYRMFPPTEKQPYKRYLGITCVR